MPRGANNVYTMPVDLTLWGRSNTKAEVLKTLRQVGYTVYEGMSQVPTQPGATSSSASNYMPPRRTFLNPQEVNSVHNKLCSGFLSLHRFMFI